MKRLAPSREGTDPQPKTLLGGKHKHPPPPAESILALRQPPGAIPLTLRCTDAARHQLTFSRKIFDTE